MHQLERFASNAQAFLETSMTQLVLRGSNTEGYGGLTEYRGNKPSFGKVMAVEGALFLNQILGVIETVARLAISLAATPFLLYTKKSREILDKIGFFPLALTVGHSISNFVCLYKNIKYYFRLPQYSSINNANNYLDV